MKYYAVIKDGLYVERRKGIVYPGEVIDFDNQQAAVLLERGFIVEIGESEYRRRIAPRYRVTDRELRKLDNMEV